MVAAESRNPIAMYNLGHLYNYGLGVPRDDVQAAIWYNKAADLGSMSARNSLALFYSKGMGNLPTDRKKALELLKTSACQGYSVAQNNLGILYFDGTNELPRDYVKSYAWFSVAFYNGFKEADASRKKTMEKLTEQDIEKAKNLSDQYILKYASVINKDGTDKQCESGSKHSLP